MVEAARVHRHAATAAEDRLWTALRGRRLDGLKFRRQYAVGPYILDLCCPELRLVIEVDGPIHDNPVEYDADRTEHLELYGYTVIRVRNEEVLTDLDAVLTRIQATADALRNRERTPPLPELGEGVGG
jgi:very-short-patch-repair endonuclease